MTKQFILRLLGVGKSDSQKVDPAVHMNKIRIILLSNIWKHCLSFIIQKLPHSDNWKRDVRWVFRPKQEKAKVRSI